MEELAPYEFKDPGEVLEQVAAVHPLTPGTALVAVVEDPATRQRVTAVEALPVDSRVGEEEDLSGLLRETMQRLPVPQWSGGGPRHSVITVLVRPGLTVFGRIESVWVRGWRYSNHLMSAYTGDLILVTEHGWADIMTGWGGYQPKMQTSA